MKSETKFDEIYKSKLKNNRKMSSPNKRMRYRKFKYKHGSSGSRKEGKQIDLSKINSKLEDLFIIPELPSGSKMIINILSTWGDKYYVGLNGIELFSSDGYTIPIKKVL